jgi:hypothetical protein
MARLLLLLAAASMLLLPASGCSSKLPVQPTPSTIQEYFDAIVDEPDPVTKYIDACDFVVPIDIFVDQVYYSYDAVRNAFPKSLINRGTDGSVTNGEIIEVAISCDTDIAAFLIQTDSSDYLYGDFYGEVNLSAAEAQGIRDAMLGFTPKGR